MKKEVPLVSICCITYNHSRYIRDAIEGFLIQKTTFPVEIIIHDDASTEGTNLIVKEYADKYPDLIFPIFQKENQYSKGIKPWPKFVFPRARGKYIALCEGDDCWTDPLKLQKQVDFMEENEDYSICFHDVKVVAENKTSDIKKYNLNYSNNQDVFTFDQLLKIGNFMHTPSVVFRIPNKELPIVNAVTGDYFLHLHNAYFGKIKRIPHIMACYRVHKGGTFSNRENWTKEKLIENSNKQIRAYKQFLKEYKLNKSQTIVINERLYSLYNNLRLTQIEYVCFSEAKDSAVQQLRSISTFKSFFKFKTIISILITLISPKLLYKTSIYSNTNPKDS